MAVGICAEAVDADDTKAKTVPVEAVPIAAKDCAFVSPAAFSEGFDEGFS